MAKLILNDVSSGFASNTAHNTNNTLIENALENTLSRDGTGPNQMEASLDMNSNTILNVAAPPNGTAAARLVDISDSDATGAASAQLRIDLAASSGTSLVGFLQSGAGAVARTLQSKERDIINVKDFGAIGDGVANDTVAVQTAISAAYGKTLEFTGGGTYKCSNLTITSPISIVGDGRTTIRAIGSKCFDVTGATISGLVLTNLLLVNAGTAGGGDNYASGLFGTGCTIIKALISNNDFSGFGIGISISGGASAITYSDAYGGSYTTQGLDGRNKIINNRIHDTLAQTRIGSGGGSSIYTQASGYWIISGNHIENMQGSILAPKYGVVSNNVIINVFDDNGIYASGSIGVAITGNYIEKTLGDGISLNGVSFCSITGNVIVAPGNSGIRFQKGHDISVSGNTVKGSPETGAYMRCFIDAGSPDGPYNINITGNSFSGGLSNVATPFSFGSSPLGTPYKNWLFANNIVSDINTSALAGAFYGPYRIIQFGDINLASNIVVVDNIFSNVTECPLRADGSYQYLTATFEGGNSIEHAVGYVTLANIASTKLSGSVRFACGALGVVDSATYSGIVTSVVKGAAAGEYDITLIRSYKIRDFGWSGSAANAPFSVRMNVVNPTAADDVVSTFTVTMYDAAGVAFWPNFNASIIFSCAAAHGSLGVV